MQFTVYSSLDLIQEKVEERQGTPQVFCFNPYLGFLGPALCFPNDYRIYGFISSTSLKIVVVAEDRDYGDQDMQQLFRQLYRLYADTISNPFFQDSLETAKFVSKLDAICEHYDKVFAS